MWSLDNQMATTLSKIDRPVGIRNGVTVQPNTPKDLDTVTELLDRIPSASGGAADVPGVWETDRTLLIAEVTAFIVAFQTINRRPTIDGAIDPNGGTLALMNKIAAEPPMRSRSSAARTTGGGDEPGLLRGQRGECARARCVA
jgi:hypothetical protein